MIQLTGAGIVGSAVGIGRVGATSTLPHEIVFDGSNTSTTAEYEFGVSGEVEPHGDVGALEADDSIDGTQVVGVLHQDRDAYRFSGNLTHLDVSGEVDVSLHYGTVDDTGPDQLVIATPADGSVEYTFDADDLVEKDLDNGDLSAEDGNDDIVHHDDGTCSVTGLTGNGYGDTYDVHGEITHFEPVDGDFTLFLNGDEVTVTELTGQETSDGSDGGSDDGSVDEHTLEIVAQDSVEFTFSTTGQITKDLNAGDYSAEEGNDDVTQNDDGTWTATGMTGNGYGDTYVFSGDVLAFDVLSGACTIYLDGQEVTPAELTGEDTTTDGTLDEVVFRVGFHVSEWLHYSLHVDSEPTGLTKDEDEYFYAGNYNVRQLADGTWLIEGKTGTGDPSGPMYGDGYRYQPEEGNGVLGWEATVPGDYEYHVSINGQAIDPATLPALDLPDTQAVDVAENGPVGGGDGYDRTVTQSDADFVVRSRSELSSALSSAGSGDVVYVPGDESIHVGSNSYAVPSGVTLASDRGVSGSSGALLYTNYEPTEVFRLYGSARLTGLRLEGPHPGDDQSGSSSARAITVHGSNVEIDNNDILAFSYAGVYVLSGEADIHHNCIRQCNKSGLGYGVSQSSGSNRIQYNYFNWNRHSVASDGTHHGYDLRYNHFGPKEFKHNIDAHEPACTRIEIHNNVVETIERLADDNINHIVAVRGVPDDVASISNNWFFNPNAPDPDGPTDSYGQVIVQSSESTWTNVSFWDNAYGENANVGYSDVIPGYTGWRT